jgi:hypothetical protein
LEGVPSKTWSFARWNKSLWGRFGGPAYLDFSKWNISRSVNSANREVAPDPSKATSDLVMAVRYPAKSWDLASGGGTSVRLDSAEIVERFLTVRQLL